MVSTNPFGEFRVACEVALRKALSELHPEATDRSLLLNEPPNRSFGELSSNVMLELAQSRSQDTPKKLADQLVPLIHADGVPAIRAVKTAGAGYINFYADFTELSRMTIDSIRSLDSRYGFVRTEKPMSIIVEHTSANPISPIHIGQARNPILGDALARVLEARGHRVSRHFYIDDVGRQVAVAAFGYRLIEKPSPMDEKPDHYIGTIYTITSCIVEISRLKRALQQAETLSPEKTMQLKSSLREWNQVADEFRKKHPRLFKLLLHQLPLDEDVEARINALNRAYEAGEPEAKRLIRETCGLSMQGLKETLSRVGVCFNSWDWESDLVWNGSVRDVLENLKKTGYVFSEGPVLEFDANKVAEDFELKENLAVKKDHEIPSLTLVRADGTTLYTTRDIPYTLWKFKQAEKVINVVGADQKLPQLQLKLALWALGNEKHARNLTHFAYSLVNLPGYTMSGRRGRYISFDEVVDEAIRKALDEVEKRSPSLSEEEKTKISRNIGIGAVKFALIEVDPTKPVVFTWDRVINFERNSAPYIQYSYARARSIMRKAERRVLEADSSLLIESVEQDIILKLSKFPETVIDSADNLKPDAIADYVIALADRFNSFYNAIPVLNTSSASLSDARLALVESVTIVLRNALSLIGIEALEKM
ncbi:arginine--tRNA ligase [Candidatus Bathyarchaeota archaeon]|nr:arginine--tRNA ligase [Candidatus Bathyarchaeota archaeon]